MCDKTFKPTQPTNTRNSRHKRSPCQNKNHSEQIRIKQTTTTDVSVNIKTFELDAKLLKLEHSWTLGNFEACSKKKWVTNAIYKFNTVSTLWGVLNNTICHEKFNLRSDHPELWFFKDDTVPHWEIVKTKCNTTELVELTVTQPSKEIMRDIVLIAIGEDITCSDDIVGIRIKSNRFGGDVRIWITKKSSVKGIQNGLISNLKQYGRIQFTAIDL